MIRRRNLRPVPTLPKKAPKPYQLDFFSSSLSFSPFLVKKSAFEFSFSLLLVIRFFLCPIGLLLAMILLGFARCLKLILALLPLVRANPASFGICRPLGI